jgi:hypothetical protein
MLRVCDLCGEVDGLPRDVIGCAIGEAPPVNTDFVNAVLRDDSLDADTKASVVADLHDNTLMLRHLDGQGCSVPNITSLEGN